MYINICIYLCMYIYEWIYIHVYMYMHTFKYILLRQVYGLAQGASQTFGTAASPNRDTWNSPFSLLHKHQSDCDFLRMLKSLKNKDRKFKTNCVHKLNRALHIRDVAYCLQHIMFEEKRRIPIIWITGFHNWINPPKS